MEAGETPEECVVREVEEETGLTVRPTEQFLTLHVTACIFTLSGIGRYYIERRLSVN